MELPPTLELDTVRKTFGDFVAVDAVSFAVPQGSLFGLLGPNGAGKTTVIRMIMDILAPDEGEVRLRGRPRTRDDLRRIGYLPEERGLYRRMTVTDQLVFLGELHGVPRGEATKRAAQWLERLGLGAWAKAKVEALSKGMQQKIQIAGTLLHEPDLLILDEPFSGLDPINQGVLKEALAELRERGTTILFSTHIMEHAEKLCDRICLISGGRVVLAGELAALKRERGGNVYRVWIDGPEATLEGLPGVAQVVPKGDGEARLLLAPEADPGEVLAAVVGRTRVREYRSEEPDLETLFIQAVRDAN
ncbi:MAG: putative ABC transporter ATP-binding protein YxlF [Acidobacteria bacterium ADurb.Bin051]|nr:MAG: putative ABC transporter ATP-binding protein YxlF [Acidobacteria bacterium ADurb.Bin051]HNZ96612.1 ATP-binding cassette domain-containing protein [Thermoanaerobaculia bacterium]